MCSLLRIIFTSKKEQIRNGYSQQPIGVKHIRHYKQTSIFSVYSYEDYEANSSWWYVSSPYVFELYSPGWGRGGRGVRDRGKHFKRVQSKSQTPALCKLSGTGHKSMGPGVERFSMSRNSCHGSWHCTVVLASIFLSAVYLFNNNPYLI